MSDAHKDYGNYRIYCDNLTKKYEEKLRYYPNYVKRCLSKALDNIREKELKEFFEESKRYI